MTPTPRPVRDPGDPRPDGVGAASRADARDVQPGAATEVTLFGLVQLIWRQRVAIVATATLVVLAAAGVVLARPRTYSATVAFMPQDSRGKSNLSGLAEQFGLSVPLAGGSQTPQFYLELLRSRPILKDVVLGSYAVRTDSGEVRGTLVDLWRVEGETMEGRVDAAVRRLDESMDESASAPTGIVRFTVAAREPELSEQIANRVVTLVNQFNLATRRSQAAAEREFVAARLEAVSADLRAAENRMQSFLQRNRGFTGAPSLKFEEERLTRELNHQRQLYSTLTEAHEQARIDEVRDTPVITVIEPAERAARPDPRGLLQTVLVAGFAGLALGMVVGLLRELGTHYRHQRRAAAGE